MGNGSNGGGWADDSIELEQNEGGREGGNKRANPNGTVGSSEDVTKEMKRFQATADFRKY